MEALTEHTASPRITPLAPPYPEALGALLQKMTPPDAPDILALFRVLALNPALAERSTAWGGYLLGRKASLPLRDREIVILRVCARCGAEYEWGVHWTAFAQAAGLGDREREAIVAHEARRDGLAARDRLLIEMVDALHDKSDIDDALWAALAAEWTPPQLIELLMLVGWYHAICYVCNVARVPLETWGERW
ncbi:carboxymuconolactone decarboxylase family protein [Variovorax defluvii]|uniref:Carboxymuconolactone decarboxylase family protein n=1 Tax=Variovorax defluvii TaxID=913761 RepID=A0ABP8HRQ7_9BURK